MAVTRWAVCCFLAAAGLSCQFQEKPPTDPHFGQRARKAAAVEGADDPNPLTGSSAVLWVHGMSCPLCANNIDKQLARVPGVTRANVDLGAGRVEVFLAPDKKPSKQQLSRAVELSGCTLTKIETP
jgi:copper chaperone CopZ